MKKGIALFLTLSFLIVVIGIISVVLNIKTSPPPPIAQNSIIIKDTLKKLNQLDSNLSTLKELFTTIPLSTKNGDFRAIISLSPYSNRFNINTIKKSTLDKILEYYQVKDPLFFEDLIFDTIDKDKIERSSNSEIVLSNPYFQQGGIFGFNHFKEILNYYATKRDDNRVFQIPWEKLIYFNKQNLYIPCEFLDDEIKVIFNTKNNCKIPKLNIYPFDKNRSFLIQIDINYTSLQKENIKLIYDITKKRLISIEDNPIY